MNERGVETSGDSVDEAVRTALSQLGLDRTSVLVDVLSAPRRTSSGVVRPARVRVTPKPDAVATPGSAGEELSMSDATSATDTEDLRTDDEAAPGAPEGGAAAVADADGVEGAAERADAAPAELSPEERMNLLDEEADLAADFVEGLLDRLDLPGDIEIEITEEQALLNLEDVGSGLLIGRRGATLDALQELVRCAVQRQTERRAHVRVDVEGYRSRHVEKLRDRCREAIAQVRETGEPVRLEPMDAYERKLMHDLVAKTGGVTSSSEGAEPKRRVVIHPDA